MSNAIIPTEVSLTVYSVVWPATENLVRRILTQETEDLLVRHRAAHTKHQDALHGPFFDAWKKFVHPCVVGLDGFAQTYPSNGSSEAIREVIRQATWNNQVLVVFNGEYEGYEALARPQGTEVIVVDRNNWHETIEQWKANGTPWGDRTAQWWVSQPSAIDGNVWEDYPQWIEEVSHLPSCQVWVDLCYVGMCHPAPVIDVSSPIIAGVVFSLSKVMGAYYRRIGGCFSREEIPGLWGNRWFKNLDSLYLGQRWLEEAGTASIHAQRCARIQSLAMEQAIEAIGGRDYWAAQGLEWLPSQVPLLMHASTTTLNNPSTAPSWWATATRGKDTPASVRLCLTPTIDPLLENIHVA